MESQIIKFSIDGNNITIDDNYSYREETIVQYSKGGEYLGSYRNIIMGGDILLKLINSTMINNIFNKEC